MAETTLQAGVTHLAVATVNEGVYLRRNGIKAPILIFGKVLKNIQSNSVKL